MPRITLRSIALPISLRSPLLAAALLISGMLLPFPVLAEQAPPNAAAPPLCSDHEERFPSCGISNADKTKAESLYNQAAKLARRQRFDEALDKLKAARDISPQDAVYASTEQALRHKIAASQLRLGDQALQIGDAAAALAAFRRAVDLDPGNQYAVQRLHDAEPAPPAPASESQLAAMEDTMGEIILSPSPGSQSFEFRGPSSVAFEKFASLFGFTTVEDQGLTSHNVRITLDNVDWETGSQILQRVCKILIVPIGEHQMLLANDSRENREALSRMSLRIFYPQTSGTPQQLTDLTTALRVLFDLRFVNPNPAKGSITIRAPLSTLDAVSRFLYDLREDEPTVMLEIKVFQLSSDFTREMGTTVPAGFSVFNVTSEIESLANSASYQQILAALAAAGQSVNAGTILGALLASSSAASPLAQPFATFGGGLGLSAITIPATNLKFSGTRSLARTLDEVLLRTEHGNTATMKVGERYPIVSTQYSATNPSSSLLSSLGLSAAAAAETGTTTIPSPQFDYEDLGMVLKATPHVHGDRISLDYELTLRALGATQSNGLPLLTNRENKGTISTRDGQSVVIAGLVSKGESTSLNGIPLLSGIPVLGKAFSVQNNGKTTDELLIVVTPHITSERGPHGIYEPVPMNVPK